MAVLSVALALVLPHSFFEDWGWLAGPAAWAACALVTARVVGLPIAGTLIGAETARRLPQARTEPLGMVELKGKAEPVEVHELIGLDTPRG